MLVYYYKYEHDIDIDTDDVTIADAATLSTRGSSLLVLRIIFALTITITIALTLSRSWANPELKIPDLGASSAGLISLADEYELGQKVLRYYRASMPLSQDPFIEDYLQNLLYSLVKHSDLADKHFELLVLESPSLNAFAAPGNIIGVNTGTFLVAHSEQQLSSILAHEFAHLSQRHYARSVQKQKKDAIASLAGMLAGVIIASTSNGDAGIATIAATQAAAIESRLRFSRDMEAEADRIGMQTLVKAQIDPQAMPEMFELLLQASRYRTKIPEFLLSHPVTESRISDSRSRAERYPRKYTDRSEDFQMIRARVMLKNENTPKNAVARFKSELSKNTLSPAAARYGLVMALTLDKQFDKAHKHLSILEKEVKPDSIAVIITKADLATVQKKIEQGLSIMQDALTRFPANHMLNVRYAELLMQASQYERCETVLLAHVKRHPQNAYIWYLLAEVHGLAGHILEVHKARAEYFILHGIYGKAEIQLKNALKLVSNKLHDRAEIEQRLYDVKLLKEEQL